MSVPKTASTNKAILKLALPAIASNITIPLLGICDTAITGHLGSEIYLAAVAAGSTIFNVVLWLCGFLRMGTTGLTAEAFGAKDFDRCSSIFRQAVVLALLLGLLVIAIHIPLLRLFMDVIAPSPEVYDMATLYFRICVWGIPPLLVTLSINGWFIGMQNTVVPMCVSISMNLFNIAASVCAVFVFKAGFPGVAMGTMIANWAGVALAAIIVVALRKRYSLKIFTRFSSKVNQPGRFFKVGGDLFLRSVCMMSVSMSITAIGARMGDLTMAVNTIMLQFFLFFSYFMDGYSFAAEALVGKNIGAKNIQGVFHITRRLALWCAAMAFAFMLIYFFGTPLITSLLTDVETVREAINAMSLYIWILPPIAVWAFLFDGVFIGLTATRRMFLTTLAATILFASVIAVGWHYYPFGSHPSSGNSILWTAFLGFLAVRGLGLSLQFRHVVKKKEVHYDNKNKETL